MSTIDTFEELKEMCDTRDLLCCYCNCGEFVILLVEDYRLTESTVADTLYKLGLSLSFTAASVSLSFFCNLPESLPLFLNASLGPSATLASKEVLNFPD